MLFHPAKGPINNILYNAFHVPKDNLPQWFTGHLIILSYILFSLWKSMGYYMVIYLAGLQGLALIHIYDAAWSILNGNEKLTFDQLNNTGLSYDKWQSVQFSDVRELQGSELALIDSGKISQSLFVKDVETYLDSNYTLHVYEKGTTRCV